MRIIHYKRVDHKARYAFKTYLRSHKGRRSPAACFWITYLDFRNLPSAKELLNKSGWHMGAYFDEYSDGETPWGGATTSLLRKTCSLSGAFKLARRGEALSTRW